MMESQITLRHATPEDTQFLASLYSDTRREEVSAWGWPPVQQELFLRMQFEAQCRSYRAVFPDAEDHIICIDRSAIGRMLVTQDQSGKHLVDIALLSEYRNRGIGTGLLRQLLYECESNGHTLSLQALHMNRAIRLYRRLGFVQSNADPMYAHLRWFPAGPVERLECQ
jgi:ribosomal protein S18 acetylase RimI-like enzyme